MVDNDQRLGGWDGDRNELESVSLNGVGLYADQPEYIDFKTSSLQLIAKSAKGIHSTDVSPACFVLGDKDLFARVRHEATSVPFLLVDDSIQIFGKLWIVPRLLGHGFAIDTSGLNANQILEKIQTYGGGDRPAILVHPAAPSQPMIYQKGVGHAENCEPFDLKATSVTEKNLDMVLDGLYNLIRSPDQSNERPLWENPVKGYPVKNAEKAVQHEVTRALAGRYGWLIDVRSEQPSSIGRTDVELIQSRGLPKGQNIRHALLELKVLRSTSVNGRNVGLKVMKRHISQGIRQASEYGEAANSKICMLCCYDMRSTDDGTEVVFHDFKQQAADRKVLLRRYYLYRSSEELRKALDNQKVDAGATPLPG